MTAQTRKMERKIQDKISRRKKRYGLEGHFLRIEEKIKMLEKKRKVIFGKKDKLISTAFTNGYIYIANPAKNYTYWDNANYGYNLTTKGI